MLQAHLMPCQVFLMYGITFSIAVGLLLFASATINGLLILRRIYNSSPIPNSLWKHFWGQFAAALSLVIVSISFGNYGLSTSLFAGYVSPGCEGGECWENPQRCATFWEALTFLLSCLGAVSLWPLICFCLKKDNVSQEQTSSPYGSRILKNFLTMATIWVLNLLVWVSTIALFLVPEKIQWNTIIDYLEIPAYSVLVPLPMILIGLFNSDWYDFIFALSTGISLLYMPLFLISPAFLFNKIGIRAQQYLLMLAVSVYTGAGMFFYISMRALGK